jgi:hypothetical protein
LFREGIDAEMFNRFKLGRTLDEAYTYGCNLLFEELALAVCMQEGAYSTDFCHPVHGNVATQSMGMLPPSPEDFCHLFHGNVATLGA